MSVRVSSKSQTKLKCSSLPAQTVEASYLKRKTEKNKHQLTFTDLKITHVFIYHLIFTCGTSPEFHFDS